MLRFSWVLCSKLREFFWSSVYDAFIFRNNLHSTSNSQLFVDDNGLDGLHNISFRTSMSGG